MVFKTQVDIVDISLLRLVRISDSETSLIAPMLPTVMAIVIDMIAQDGFRFKIAHKNAPKKRNPKT